MGCVPNFSLLPTLADSSTEELLAHCTSWQREEKWRVMSNLRLAHAGFGSGLRDDVISCHTDCILETEGREMQDISVSSSGSTSRFWINPDPAHCDVIMSCHGLTKLYHVIDWLLTTIIIIIRGHDIFYLV